MPQAPATHLPLSYVTINKDWVITRCSSSAAPWIGAAVGRNMWELWPEAERYFRPIHERAWRDGLACGFGFFNGTLFHIESHRADDETLLCRFDQPVTLDLTTLRSAAEGFLQMEELLAGALDGHPFAEQPFSAPLHLV